MQDLHIKDTVNSPEIITNYTNNEIAIKGESYPENPFKFYEPLIEFLDEYVKVKKKLYLSIHLIYYNSSTAKVFYDIFDIIHEASLEVEVQWIYSENNELALENGEDYAEDYPDLNIKLIQKGKI